MTPSGDDYASIVQCECLGCPVCYQASQFTGETRSLSLSFILSFDGMSDSMDVVLLALLQRKIASTTATPLLWAACDAGNVGTCCTTLQCADHTAAFSFMRSLCAIQAVGVLDSTHLPKLCRVLKFRRKKRKTFSMKSEVCVCVCVQSAAHAAASISFCSGGSCPAAESAKVRQEGPGNRHA